MPPSVKIAIGFGTIAGATLAVINNREKIKETAEHLFEQGSEFCRKKLDEFKQVNHHMANNVEDGFYSEYAAQEKNLAKSSGISRRYDEDNSTPEYTEDEDEAMTPDASDYEYDEKDIDTHSLD